LKVYILRGSYDLMLVNSGVILRSKGQGVKVTGNENAKFFLCISSWKVDRFISNQGQNDLRLILRISSDTIQQRKRI